MLPKSIILPRPNFKTIEEAQKWADNLISALQIYHLKLYDEFQENEKFICIGNDKKHVHGFVSRKADFVE